MRISNNYISNQIIQNLNIDLARLSQIQEQVSTGVRIKVPSQDPLAAQRIVDLNEAMSGIAQHQRNAQYVGNWLSATESTLSGAADTLKRAHSLAVRGANDASLGQTELNAIADEVNGILENIVAAANTQSEGKYILGGFQTLSTPFTVTRVAGEITAVTYAGDNGVESVEIDLGQTVNKNLPGSQVFQPAAGTDVFAVLITLRNDLRAGNAAGVTAAVDATETAHQQVEDQIAIIGNRTTLMESITSNLTSKKEGLIKLNSQLADVDMPEAIVRLQTAQNVYSAALESSAKLLEQPSLMHFLG